LRRIARTLKALLSSNGDRPSICCDAATLRRVAAELAASRMQPTRRTYAQNTAAGTGRAKSRRKIARMAEQYPSGQQRLDLANASPAELLAFCVAVEMERGDEVSLPSRAWRCPACPSTRPWRCGLGTGGGGGEGISIGGVGCVSIAFEDVRPEPRRCQPQVVWLHCRMCEAVG
jgi:hypothetical protein